MSNGKDLNMRTVNVLAIAGSLRGGAYSAALVRAAQHVFVPGVSVHQWTDLAAVPPFSEDHESRPPEPVTAMREAFEQADALLISTPEYNGMMPGQLKNALDWASRPYGYSALTGKPVAVMSISPSDYGAKWAGDGLRRVLEQSGAAVVDVELCVPGADRAFDPDGSLENLGRRETLLKLLMAVADAIAERAHALSHAGGGSSSRTRPRRRAMIGCGRRIDRDGWR